MTTEPIAAVDRWGLLRAPQYPPYGRRQLSSTVMLSFNEIGKNFDVALNEVKKANRAELFFYAIWAICLYCFQTDDEKHLSHYIASLVTGLNLILASKLNTFFVNLFWVIGVIPIKISYKFTKNNWNCDHIFNRDFIYS